jgi:hypothetical protein
MNTTVWKPLYPDAVSCNLPLSLHDQVIDYLTSPIAPQQSIWSSLDWIGPMVAQITRQVTENITGSIQGARVKPSALKSGDQQNPKDSATSKGSKYQPDSASKTSQHLAWIFLLVAMNGAPSFLQLGTQLLFVFGTRGSVGNGALPVPNRYCITLTSMMNG